MDWLVAAFQATLLILSLFGAIGLSAGIVRVSDFIFDKYGVFWGCVSVGSFFSIVIWVLAFFAFWKDVI